MILIGMRKIHSYLAALRLTALTPLRAAPPWGSACPHLLRALCESGGG
jgi:hypothetical protein